MDSLWTTSSFDALIALIGILALILACAWLMRRLQNQGGHGKQHLRVVSVLALSAKERVVLIEVGDEQLLMGVSAAGINRLHTLEHPIRSKTSNSIAPRASFAESLRDVILRSRA